MYNNIMSFPKERFYYHRNDCWTKYIRILVGMELGLLHEIPIGSRYTLLLIGHCNKQIEKNNEHSRYGNLRIKNVCLIQLPL